MAGILLGIWGLGSAVSGVFFGTRRLSMAINRQLSFLLAAVALTFAVYAAVGIAALVAGWPTGGVARAEALAAC